MNKLTIKKILFVIVVTQLITLGGIPDLGSKHVMAASIQRFSLLAETMQPVDSTIGYNNTSGYLTTTTNSAVNGVTQYIGQLHLPDGATIINMIGFGLDTDPNSQFYFRLYRYNLNNVPIWSAVTDFAYSGVPYSNGIIEIPAAVDPGMAVVDNAQFSYGLFLVLPVASTGQLGVLRFMVETSVPQSNRAVVIPLFE